jgi:uncharacterized repeat protein (TIGR02543 family)
MKSLKNAIIALTLSSSLVLFSGCDMLDGILNSLESSSGNAETATKYSVRFVTYSGAENLDTTYEEGDEITLPTPTRENFNFAGWYDNSSFEGSTVTKITTSDTGDKTFYALWSAKTYNITLNFNGGSSDQIVETYTYNTSVTLPYSVEKVGYTFGGWYADSAYKGEVVTSIAKGESGDKQFWAKWSANSYNIVYTLNGGTLSGNAATSYTYGTETPLLTPEREGYTFVGWYYGGERLTSISAESIGDINLSAEWEKIPAKSYGITYNLCGGTLEGEVTSYTEGTTLTLATPQREHYNFVGWSSTEDGTELVSQISQTDSGNKTFWAVWEAESYSVTLNLDGGALAENLISYTYGNGVTLPTPTKSGYTFVGWYDNQSFTGEKVTQISKTDFGNKEYFAKWKQNSTINITAISGYDEGAYVEFDTLSGVSNYSVYYKSESQSAYTKLESELVRIKGNTVRADVVGISSGTYSFKIVADGTTQLSESVSVTAYDRSGYAHFGATSAVGAYNNDGTPKSNAQIIYVNEATKNTVSVKFGKTTYTGIANILSNLSKAQTPVIIRVLGQISAATWNRIEYKTSSKTEITPDDVVGANGKTLSKKNWTQADLISGGYNTLNTSVYSELKGLSSTIKYDSTKGEFDSCWNNCSISGAENVTLEGIGTDAELFQWGLTWGKCNSIEVRNLTFDDYTEDACSFEGSENSTTVDGFNSQRIWVHNNTFNEGINYWDVCNEQDKHEGDGATDFKKCSYITISYNHYYKNHKTGLIGGGDTQTTANVTFHHNFYDSCVSRLPLSRQANMHMYNNYYYNSTGTNMSIRAGGYAFIENCYFENANTPIETKTGDGKAGVAKIYGCVFTGKKLSTTDSNLHVVTDRTAKVSNDNIFNKNFDTDSSAFYYNSTTKKTEVSLLSSAEQAKVDCKAKSGVLR